MQPMGSPLSARPAGTDINADEIIKIAVAFLLLAEALRRCDGPLPSFACGHDGARPRKTSQSLP
jgi:hypothetical protein